MKRWYKIECSPWFRAFATIVLALAIHQIGWMLFKEDVIRLVRGPVLEVRDVIVEPPRANPGDAVTLTYTNVRRRDSSGVITHFWTGPSGKLVKALPNAIAGYTPADNKVHRIAVTITVPEAAAGLPWVEYDCVIQHMSEPDNPSVCPSARVEIISHESVK